jgi:hypothetical protein
MPLPLPGSASCICTLLRPFVLRAQDGKPGQQALLIPPRPTDPCKFDYRALLLDTHSLLKPRERVLSTAACDIPQAWDMIWEPVQHFTSVFLAVRPHSISQKCLHLSLSHLCATSFVPIDD